MPRAKDEGGVKTFAHGAHRLIWVMRLKTKLSLRVLDDFSNQYGDKLVKTA